MQSGSKNPRKQLCSSGNPISGDTLSIQEQKWTLQVLWYFFQDDHSSTQFYTLQSNIPFVVYF